MRRAALSVGLAIAVASSAALGGCELDPPEVKIEEELVGLRTEREALLDELYQAYGQGELAQAIQDKTAKKGEKAADKDESVTKELLDAVGQAAAEVDRAAFDSHCETLGTGERPSVLSERGRAFFDKPSTRKACGRVAQIEVRIEALERRLERVKDGEE